jgi:hypothetical protein
MAKKKSIHKKPAKKVNPIVQKAHPWRICPLGYYFVKEHLRKRLGKVETVHSYCAKNPSGRDQLYDDEIEEVSGSAPFRKAKPLPASNSFDFGKKGNADDTLIAGWVQYWNDVLQPKEKLDPDLVKALIASESSFESNLRIKAGARNYANGLTQITDKTLTALRNEDGELSDQYVHVTKKEVMNPSSNICAGVRWLFQKQKLASGKLNRSASWIESVGEYKSAIKSYHSKNVIYDQHAMQNFLSQYQWIKTGVRPKKK